MVNAPENGREAASEAFNLGLLGDVPVIPVTGMFNQFSNTGDLSSVLYTNGKPAMVLNMNMIVAKTYALMIMDLVQRYEAATGVPLDSMTQLQDRFDAFASKHGIS